MNEKQYGVRLPAWHVEALEELAEASGARDTTVARELLMAAIEQASGKKPEGLPLHLQKFWDGAK